MIQEHIKKPLADELLFGKLEHGGTVKIELIGTGFDKKLNFEGKESFCEFFTSVTWDS